jgi:hypothetical protein
VSPIKKQISADPIGRAYKSAIQVPLGRLKCSADLLLET